VTFLKRRGDAKGSSRLLAEVKGRRTAAKKRVPATAVTKGSMQVRVVSLAVLVAVVFMVLGVRLWQLQVLTGDDYSLYAQATHTREVKIPAQRGVIYDRTGKVLANNVPGLNVTVVPSEMPRERVAQLATILEADRESVLERYDTASEGNPYGSILVKENADRDDVTYISERTEEFPGVTINDDYVRNYPQGEMAAHVLGYTGAITEEEIDKEIFDGLSNDAVVGKNGVELTYEELLRGKPGSKNYNVDALGRVVALRRADGSRVDGQGDVSPLLGRPASVTDPAPGNDLTLTIDMELQEVAEDELDAAITRAREKGYSGTGGAIVALNPRNGEILAMASRPNYEPQLFVGGISGAEEAEIFEHLNSEDGNSPFTNRAVNGAYPAASAFKVFTGIAGLVYGVIDPYTTVTDTGACWRPAGTSGGCWQSWRENSGKGVHGTQNYAEALGDSNNKFFYQVVDWVWNRTEDVDWLPHFYERFGFGHKTGVDLPSESAGRMPDSRWQEENAGTPDDRIWAVWRWVNMAIGQGDVLVTPLQMARAYAAIENGGTLVTPHVGKEIRDQNGGLIEKISPQPAGKLDIDPSLFQETIDGMRMVTSTGGTAEWAFKGSRLPIVGKSGTGEVSAGTKDPVNWFAGWVENGDKPLVVLAMVEGGGFLDAGSDVTAAPAVRHVLEAHYGVEQSPKDVWRTAEMPAREESPAGPGADGPGAGINASESQTPGSPAGAPVWPAGAAASPAASSVTGIPSG
jgi:penicillin-binding protein 2